nr:MAG TPA: hypothetical protein [Caudoviricetes sp.]
MVLKNINYINFFIWLTYQAHYCSDATLYLLLQHQQKYLK